MKTLPLILILAALASLTGAYDIVVYGSEPPAVAAAIGAAREGASVAIITDEDRLGGLWTVAGLNTLDIMLVDYKDEHFLPATGVFTEILGKLGNKVYASAVDDGFVPDRMQEVLDQLTRDAGVTVILNQKLKRLNYVRTSIFTVTRRRVASITTQNLLTNENNIYPAGIFIDGSDTGALGEMAGVPYSVGRSDITGNPDDAKEVMITTAMFEIKNVPWSTYQLANNNEFFKHDFGTLPTSFAGLHDLGDAFSNKFVPNGGCPEILNDPEFKFYFGGFNAGKISEDTILVNGLEIYGVSPTDEMQRQRAQEYAGKAAKCIERFFNSCFITFTSSTVCSSQIVNNNVKVHTFRNFAGAEVSLSGKKLYIRESRRFSGLTTVTNEDAIANAQYWDNLAISPYFMDLRASWSFHPDNVELPEYARNAMYYYRSKGYLPADLDIQKKKRFGIPLRAAVASNIENLAFVGKIASYESLAFASARVMPAGVTMGYSVGIASAKAAKLGITMHELAKNPIRVNALQDDLENKYGITLYPIFNIDKTDPDYKAFRYLMGERVIDFVDLYNSPDGQVSRGLFAMLIVKAAGYKIETPAQPTYEDVQPEDPVWGWAYPYIETATAQGVLSARTPNQFYPGAAVSREELAITTAKISRLPQPTQGIPFQDRVTDRTGTHSLGDGNYAFYAPIAQVYQYSGSCPCLVGSACSTKRPIIGDVNDGTTLPYFGPYNPVTLREVARTIYRQPRCI